MNETNRLSNRELAKFKANAQRLKPILKLGEAGITTAFLQSVNTALEAHELIKIKLDAFKDQRKTIAPELASKTGSHLVTLLGHMVVLYRPKAVVAERAGSVPHK